MAKAASIHFVAAKVAADKHNKREKDLSYVRKEMEQNVPLEKWFWESPNYKSVYELRKQAEKEYYDKEISVVGNHGPYVTHRSMPKNAEPVKEGVVAINENVTIEQIREFGEWCQEKWGIAPMGIYIHYGEGHWAPLFEEEGQTEDMYRRTDGHEWKRVNAAGITEYWKPNLHAHIIFDWFNHDTQRCYNLGPKVMIEIEDKLAEVLKMQRGKRSNKNWLDSIAFKVKAEQERAAKEKKLIEKEQSKLKEELETTKKDKNAIDAEIAKALKTVKALTTMVENLQEKLDKGEGDVEDLQKKLEDKQQKLAAAEEKLKDIVSKKNVAEGMLQNVRKYGKLAAVNKSSLKNVTPVNLQPKVQNLFDNIRQKLDATPIPIIGKDAWREDRKKEIFSLLKAFLEDSQKECNNTYTSAKQCVDDIYAYYMQHIDILSKDDKGLIEAVAADANRNALKDFAKVFKREDLLQLFDSAAELGGFLHEDNERKILEVANYVHFATHQKPEVIVALSTEWNTWKNANCDLFDSNGNFAKALRKAAWALENKIYDNKVGLLKAFNEVTNIGFSNSKSLYSWNKEDAQNVAKGVFLISALNLDESQRTEARIALGEVVLMCDVSKENNRQIENRKENTHSLAIFEHDQVQEAVSAIAQKAQNPEAKSLSPLQVEKIFNALCLFDEDYRENAANNMVNMARQEWNQVPKWMDDTAEEITGIVEHFAELAVLMAIPSQGPSISSGGGGGGNNDLPKSRDDEWWKKYHSIPLSGSRRSGKKR